MIVQLLGIRLSGTTNVGPGPLSAVAAIASPFEPPSCARRTALSEVRSNAQKRAVPHLFFRRNISTSLFGVSSVVRRNTSDGSIRVALRIADCHVKPEDFIGQIQS